jgi:hypothetical protein
MCLRRRAEGREGGGDEEIGRSVGGEGKSVGKKRRGRGEREGRMSREGVP